MATKAKNEPSLIDRMRRRLSIDSPVKPKPTAGEIAPESPAGRGRSASAPPRVEGQGEAQAAPPTTGRARSDSAPPRLEGNVAEPKRRSSAATAVRDFFFPLRLEGRGMSAISGAMRKQAGVEAKVLESVNTSRDEMWMHVFNMNKLIREMGTETDSKKLKDQFKEFEQLKQKFDKDAAGYDAAVKALGGTRYQEEFADKKIDLASARERVNTIEQKVQTKQKEFNTRRSMTQEEVSVKSLLEGAREDARQFLEHRDNADLAFITDNKSGFTTNFDNAKASHAALKEKVAKLEAALKSDSLEENKTLYAKVKKEVEHLGVVAITQDRMISSIVEEAKAGVTFFL